MQGQLPKRWGEEQEDLSVIDLLAKKDQEITRLKGILQWERRRADHAARMLQLSKNVMNQSEQASQGLKSEITRRIKAEEEVKRLTKRNEELQNGIKKYVELLKIQLQDKKQRLKDVQQSAEQRSK